MLKREIPLPIPKTIEEDFQEFVNLRQEASHLAMIASGKGKERDKYSNKWRLAYDEIYKRLGANEEAYTLLEELTMAANLSFGLEIDAAYVQGFQDGMRFRDLLTLGPKALWGNRRMSSGIHETEPETEERPA